ncbi:sigma-70 family RNA polymerase sigma factor [Halobacillus sp. A1]|uniref:sigma-70 family RNA polymerase sigma factor n=1 Tax=Halobacillus sp. A1 TaxID=2880262 RepID=UPI0020A69CEF|nr:sigma-70 family RNA polymerase sigma factor [Halobacillus sp. A1]MCP3030081.1 sigma-70 family RNA polymerase sigma factor [Halobacillus sp. A1]
MRKQIQEPLLSSLQHPIYAHADNTAVQSPSSKNGNDINELFYPCQSEAKFVSYVNTALWRAAKDYRKKCYTLKDQYVMDVEKIELADITKEEPVHYQDLYESLEDKILYHTIKQLSQRQQFILYEHAVDLYTFKEIADELSVSQQSVSKSYQRAVIKLRGAYQGGD